MSGELSEAKKRAIVARREAVRRTRIVDCPCCGGLGIDPRYEEDDIGCDDGDCEECGGTGSIAYQEEP